MRIYHEDHKGHEDMELAEEKILQSTHSLVYCPVVL